MVHIQPVLRQTGLFYGSTQGGRFSFYKINYFFSMNQFNQLPVIALTTNEMVELQGGKSDLFPSSPWYDKPVPPFIPTPKQLQDAFSQLP